MVRPPCSPHSRSNDPKNERGVSRTPRIVVTGVGLTTPIGHDMNTVASALKEGRHGIAVQEDWGRIEELHTRLGGMVTGLELDGRWPRKARRTMGRVGLLAASATEDALRDAGLTTQALTSGRVGLAYGSTHGSSQSLEDFCRRAFGSNSLADVAGSEFIRFTSHTCAANLAMLFGIRGRVVSTSAACVSGSQAIGAGVEALRLGAADIMICGGAEELHFMTAGVFALFAATSTTYNDRPDLSPRPFDAARDGLVVGEGSATLVIETLKNALARNRPIHGEILGYATSCDGSHITAPSAEGMARCMRLALADAGLEPAQIDYINAHATATRVGDAAEAEATLDVFGRRTPISSTKGHTGHTLGACGAIETAFCLAMVQDSFLAATRNLEHVDPECDGLDHVRATRAVELRATMNNNFAFGGMNTSLIIGPAPRF